VKWKGERTEGGENAAREGRIYLDLELLYIRKVKVFVGYGIYARTRYGVDGLVWSGAI
jgi:hypothetical protein